MPGSPELAILTTARPQHGLLTRAQIAELGVSSQVIARMLRQGFLTRPRRGLYSVGPPATTTAARTTAASLLLPGSVAYRRTAADLLGLPGRWSGGVELAIGPGRFSEIDGVVLHETIHLPSIDLTRVDGVPCTRLERTLIDVVNVSSDRRIMWLVDRATDRADFSIRRLQACFLSFARRGRGGTRRMRPVVDHFASTEAIDRSRLERAFARLKAEHDLGSGWVAEYRPPWYDGIRGVVDNALPEAHLIVETDGRRWHRRDENIQEDRRRDRVAAAHGWQVARYGYEEVTERPAEVAAELRALRALRRAA